MLITKNKIPQIRFNGFIGEWEEKVLDEISSAIFDGTHQTPRYTNSGIPFFSVENLISKSENKYISNEDYIEATKKNKPEKNDILITRIGNIGFSKVVTWDFDFSIYVTLAVVKESKIFDSFYLSHYMQSSKYQSEILSKSLLSAVPCKINMNELRNTKVVLPKSLTEQTKIGNYFQQLDKLIEQKEKKHQKLKQFKKAMIDKMFPKNGADTPEIRFKGFSGKWEEKSLGDIGEVVTGSTPSTQEPLYYSKNGIPWVTPTDISKNVTLHTARHLSVKGQKVARIVPKNTILVTSIASIGKNTILGTKGSFNQQINGLIPNEQKHNPYFLFTQSTLWSNKMKRIAASGTMQIVNKKEFSELMTKLPQIEEQEKIGNYFQKLDKQIDLQIKEIEKLKNIKKASLDKMFV